MEWYGVALLILSPFLIYLFFRLVFGAFFKSYYEGKILFLKWFLNLKKGEKNGI